MSADDPTCGECGASLADDEMTEVVEPYTPSIGRVLRGIFAPLIGGGVLALALVITADSLSCGYNDATHPYNEGSSYGAFAIQHTPTYWLAYQLAKPRVELYEPHVRTYYIPMPQTCNDPTDPCSLEPVPSPHIHIHAKGSSS